MEKRRYYSFDFLKIIATVFIVFHHFQQLFRESYIGNRVFFGGGFYFGWLVEFFFILSGLFMYSYVEQINNGLSLKRFYFRRASRLVPLLMITAIAYEGCLLLFHALFKEYWSGYSVNVWGTVLSGLGLGRGGSFTKWSVNSPTWYVSVLIICYVVFYVLTYLAKRLKIHPEYLYIFMILLGCGINTFEISLPFLNDGSARGYYAFFVGVLLGKHLTRGRVGKKELALCFVSVASLTLIMSFSFSWVEDGLNYLLTFIYYPAIIVLFSSNPVNKFFNLKYVGKITGVLGRISFDVYVWHYVCMLLYLITIKRYPVFVEARSFKGMLICSAFCFVVGTLSYFCIEKPINKAINKKMVSLSD